MDATTAYALRVVTLIAIGGGLPAWAIFGNFPMPSHATTPKIAAQPPRETPAALVAQAPRAKLTKMEPIAPAPASPGHSASIAAPPPANTPPGPTDRLSQVQDRLKQLGAYYLLLESMQGNSPNYRFHVALGSGPSDSTGRRFEATDSQPMRAMERVLADVEQWSAQRISLRGTATERR